MKLDPSYGLLEMLSSVGSRLRMLSSGVFSRKAMYTKLVMQHLIPDLKNNSDISKGIFLTTFIEVF